MASFFTTASQLAALTPSAASGREQARRGTIRAGQAPQPQLCARRPPQRRRELPPVELERAPVPEGDLLHRGGAPRLRLAHLHLLAPAAEGARETGSERSRALCGHCEGV